MYFLITQFSSVSRYFLPLGLGPYMFLSTLFLNTLRLCSFLNLTEQVSKPYKTTDKIIVLYISILISLNSKREGKRFYTKWQQEFPEFNLPLISSCMQFFLLSFRIIA
jgi:hypothetical protein